MHVDPAVDIATRGGETFVKVSEQFLLILFIIVSFISFNLAARKECMVVAKMIRYSLLPY
jgi:hypothetical protein